jgi:hypothetical protein
VSAIRPESCRRSPSHGFQLWPHVGSDEPLAALRLSVPSPAHLLKATAMSYPFFCFQYCELCDAIHAACPCSIKDDFLHDADAEA